MTQVEKELIKNGSGAKDFIFFRYRAFFLFDMNILNLFKYFWILLKLSWSNLHTMCNSLIIINYKLFNKFN